MKKIVLDTSVLIKWFTKEKGHLQAKKLLTSLEGNKVKVYLPELTKYEFGNALFKGKNFSYFKANKTLITFYNLPLTFVPEDLKLANLSYKIAQKLNITYYDACFLALAKKEKAILITANPKHQKPIKGIKVKKLS